MWIATTVGGRRHGGYETDAFQASVKEYEGGVLVNFKLKGQSHEEGGFHLGRTTAKWLAHALLSAAEGFCDHEKGEKADFKGDRIIPQPAPQPDQPPVPTTWKPGLL